MNGKLRCSSEEEHTITRNAKAPTELVLFIRRLAESIELKRNMLTTLTAKAMILTIKGEKLKSETNILYKGMLFSPVLNSGFMMKVGNHKTIAITTTTICCAR